ncbi:phage distal tail protein, Rcc01695 family [Arenibacterium sp. LLYu02]|uniref:phage distal tail protein, Rcc01695 family n=1 Tax=Arenibacterium sp. LLYu02 TaxID=3404132 RepID=UPI003B20CB6F
MSFHEVRFPETLSFGSVGGPERRTDVVTLANGFEERNTPWAHARRRYDAGLGLRSLQDIAQLIAFFEARQGQLHGFRWKDWTDYASAQPGAEVTFEDQEIAVADGATTVFQLAKLYRSGPHSYLRPISKPVAGSVRLGIDNEALVEGIDYDLDLTTGQVTLGYAPEIGRVIKAGFEFDVPVRFDTDRIQTSVASFQAGEAPNVPVVEVRV